MKNKGKRWQPRLVKASPMWKDTASPEDVVAKGLSVLMGELMDHVDSKGKKAKSTTGNQSSEGSTDAR